MEALDAQRIDDEICRRLQKIGEPFKDFVVELHLMMQRANYTDEQKLNRVYANLLPEYRLFTRRHDFSTLAQLTWLVTEYEVTRDRIDRTVNALRPQAATGLQANQGWSALRYEEGRLVASVTINRQRKDATIDTGATRSLIKEHTALQLAKEGELRSVSTNLSLADGSTQAVSQEFRVGVCHGQHEVILSFMVLPNILDNIILGMDFLCCIGATLSFDQAKLTLNPYMLLQTRTTVSVKSEAVKDEWIEPPPTWIIYAEGGKLPRRLIERLEKRLANNTRRVRFLEEAEGRHFRVNMSKQNLLTVVLCTVEWSKAIQPHINTI